MKKKLIRNMNRVTMCFLILILAVCVSFGIWKKQDTQETESEEVIASIQGVPAGTIVNVSDIPREELAHLFYDTGIPRELVARIDRMFY